MAELIQILSFFLGAIRDATGAYTYTFVISGCVLALAGIIPLPIRRVARWERRNETGHDLYTEVWGHLDL